MRIAPHTSPTVRAGALQGFSRLAGELSPALLSRHGIGDLDDPNAKLDLSRVACLLNATSDALGCPDFALRLGSFPLTDGARPLGAVLDSAQTVREALRLASRYMPLHSSGYTFGVIKQSEVVRDEAVASFQIHLRSAVKEEHLLVSCLAMIITQLREASSGHFTVGAVTLPLPARRNRTRLEEFFDCRVVFESPSATFRFPQELGDLPLSAGETSRMPALPSRPALGELVEHVLALRMGAEATGRSDIAQFLLMHPRTLQRRLCEEGNSFSKIDENLRITMLLRYLRESEYSLTEIAAAMGYSEPSALTRFSHRVFGEAPNVVRAWLRAHADESWEAGSETPPVFKDIESGFSLRVAS